MANNETPWCKVLVCGAREFSVSAVRSVASSGGNVGDVRYELGSIRVKFAERTHMEDTLFHELTHAVWESCGLKDTLRRRWASKLSESELSDLEEDILVAQTPGLLATLKQAGWLRLPPPPER